MFFDLNEIKNEKCSPAKAASKVLFHRQSFWHFSCSLGEKWGVYMAFQKVWNFSRVQKVCTLKKIVAKVSFQHVTEVEK